MNSTSTQLDRTGVLASVLCGIHCAIAPLILLLAPALGGVWTHPLSHFAIGAVVLPVGAIALRRGFRSHGRTWIAAVGGLGILLIVAGMASPYLGGSGVVADAAAETCGDSCCPSFVVDHVTGTERLNIPPASILTLLGGISLVTAHLANLRCCAGCVHS